MSDVTYRIHGILQAPTPFWCGGLMSNHNVIFISSQFPPDLTDGQVLDFEDDRGIVLKLLVGHRVGGPDSPLLYCEVVEDPVGCLALLDTTGPHERKPGE